MKQDAMHKPYTGQAWDKKDAKVHLYSDELGYPLRLCDWLGPESILERAEGPPTCRHCLKIQQGRRRVACQLEDRIVPLKQPPPVLASHEGDPLALQALREKLVLAEAEARASALRHPLGYFAKGLRVGFALTLKMLLQLKQPPWSTEELWAKARHENAEFEAEAQKSRQGHKG